MHKRIDPFEFIYFLAYSTVKRYKLHRQKKLPAKVVSIGNITTGGSGKTPATIALAQEAYGRGLTPVILTRGYKGKSKEPVLVNFPENVHHVGIKTQDRSNITAEMLGDEAFMVAEKLKSVPIVKYPDRYKAGQLALERLKTVDSNHQVVFILDDGFQHWSLYRDIDVVLVDGVNPFGNGKLLPFGILRELPDELRRADFLVITKKRNEELYNRLRHINPKAPIFFSEYMAADVKYSDGRSYSLAAMRGKRVFAFCGIAQPESFIGTISSLGADVAGFKEFPDHHSYRDKDIQNIRKFADRLKAEILITTEKDIVKIRGRNNLHNIYYIAIEFSIEAGFYDDVLSRIL